jgi:hypothetical protein
MPSLRLLALSWISSPFQVFVLASGLTIGLMQSAFAGELALYMIEQRGCIYCERWDADVGDAYHLTTEGKTAPLIRHDLRAPPPKGVTFARKPQFTPTFILVKDGQELDRIEGYPGEDFFYGMLGVMLKNVDAPVN